MFHFARSKKRYLFISGIFLLSFGIFGLTQTAQAVFNCDSGDLSTTCYVTTTQTISSTSTISGTGNLVIQSGGNITCSTGTASTIAMGGDITIESGGYIFANVELTAANLTIDSGGAINLNGKGYYGGGKWGQSYGQGDGGGSYSGSFYGAGGGYGGNGGAGVGCTGGDTYGSTTQPTDYGSGGGFGSCGGSCYYGGNGGGSLKITVSGTTTINGIISANGENGTPSTDSFRNPGGGSGGSIWIITGVFTGSGTTSANGGNAGRSSGGAGGGGRIAINYTTDSYAGVKTAYGAYTTGAQKGGAGTIFIKSSVATNGDLIIANAGVSGAYTTQVPTSLAVDNLTVKDAAKPLIPDSYSLTVASGFTDCASDAYLYITGTLNLPSAKADFSDTPSIVNNGTINNASTSADFNGITYYHNGVLNNVTNISVANGTFYRQDGTTPAGTPSLILSTAGLFEVQSTSTALDLSSLTIQSGGNLSCVTSSIIDLNVTNDITIESGGYIFANVDLTAVNLTINSGGYLSANAKGYYGGGKWGSSDGEGPGGGVYPSGQSGTFSGGGGGYGGDGGRAILSTATGGPSYGSTTMPSDLGSGGGYGANGGSPAYGGNGGGAIRLTVSGTTTVNGIISANGENATIGSGSSYRAGGGSGGSVWIITGVFTGSGTTSANGGNAYYSNGGVGGGGRVAVYYTTDSSTIVKTSYGGYTTGYVKGGAGTIFIKGPSSTYGDLIVANAGVSGTYTTQVPTDLSIDAITIKNRANYLIPNGFSFAPTSFLGCTSDAYLYVSGTLNLPSAKSDFSDISSIVNNGTINNASTSMNIDGANFYHNGVLNNVTNISVANGTFYRQDGTTPAGTPSLILSTAGVFDVQTTSTAVSLNSLTIQNGGNFICVTSSIADINVSNDVTIESGGYIFANVDLTATNLTIDSGGYISANGKGYYGGGKWGSNDGQGPGGGVYATNGSYWRGGGGGYGGAGGAAALAAATGGPSYGSSTLPTDFGSGGGYAQNNYYGGNGGGAIRLTVSGTTTINGVLSSDGERSIGGNSSYTSGGGSGGSVLIQTNVFAGSGTTTANGGNAYYTNGGRGGGGRIYIGFTTWQYTNTAITASAATTGYTAAEAGTILPYVLSFNAPMANSSTSQNLAVQPAIIIRDLLGATSTSVSDDVTIAIGSNPSGGTLNGTLSVAPVSGIATFSGLSIDKAGSGYTLIATGPGMTSVTSVSFDIIATNPSAPTIAPPLALSSTVIRWNFVDNSDNETGFMAYNDTGSMATSQATENISYLDETGLTPNTQYTRYINAYNDYGLSASSSATSTYTLASAAPTGFNFMRHPLSLEIYVDSFPNDTVGSAGYLFWRTDNSSYNSTWIQTNTWQDPNMVEGQTYTYAVKYRNSSGTETATSTLTGVYFVRNIGIENPAPAPPQENPTTTLPSGSRATSSEDISSLLEKISQLQKEIAKVQALINSQAKPASSNILSGFLFQNNLKPGLVDPEVKYLQIFLNQNQETQVSQTGPGSPSQETNYFGPATKAAVILFQEKYANEILKPWGLKKGNGFVGPSTRSKINQLIGE